MKGNYLYMALVFVLASMMACQQDIPGIEQSDEEARRIYLSAGIGKDVSSRAPYSPTDGKPTGANPLNVSVWASTTNNIGFPHKEDANGNAYDGSIGNEVAIHTTACFQSAEPQLLGEAIYPTPPEGDTIVVNFNNQDASFTFTGKEDVMFAPMIDGKYGLNYEENPNLIPTFHFYHLLTWLRIKMVADMEETDVFKKETVQKAWGEIKSITLTNQPTTVPINTLGAVTKDNLSSYVVFSGKTDGMSLYQSDDSKFPSANNNRIPITETEVAYVMCAPVEAKHMHMVYEDEEQVNGKEELFREYTLHIVTDKYPEGLDIPIDLRKSDGEGENAYFKGSTMGKQFTILLNFKMGDVISLSREISLGGDTDWFTHGTGTGELTEDKLDVPVN